MQKHHFTKGFTPESLRSMLEGLGPSFVKIGQTLSTRSEILPKAYCDELKKLQARSKPLPFDEMLAAMDSIYGDEREKLFAEIDPKPLGSASLAQVHKARLADGSVVAVKIQRPACAPPWRRISTSCVSWLGRRRGSSKTADARLA